MRRTSRPAQTAPTGWINHRGIIIPYDTKAPGYIRCATLVATLAHPPAFPGDPDHENLVIAFCRLATHRAERVDPAGFRQPQTGTYVRAHYSYDLESARMLTAHAWCAINRQFGASHTLMPFLWEALEKAGIKVAGRPPTPQLNGSIMRTHRYEQDRLDELERRNGERPPHRFPMGRDQLNEKNVMTTVLKPARPVLHVLAAVEQAMELVAPVFRDRLPAAEAAGLSIDVRGPQLTWWMFEQIPELADYVVKASCIYELGLPHLKVQRPHADQVVRFRSLGLAGVIPAQNEGLCEKRSPRRALSGRLTSAARVGGVKPYAPARDASPLLDGRGG